MLTPHDALLPLVARRAPGIRDESRHHHNMAAQVIQASQGAALEHLCLKGTHLVDVDGGVSVGCRPPDHHKT